MRTFGTPLSRQGAAPAAIQRLSTNTHGEPSCPARRMRDVTDTVIAIAREVQPPADLSSDNSRNWQSCSSAAHGSPADLAVLAGSALAPGG